MKSKSFNLRKRVIVTGLTMHDTVKISPLVTGRNDLSKSYYLLLNYI